MAATPFKSAVEALVQEHKLYETDRAQWDYERTELLNRYVHTDVLLWFDLVSSLSDFWTSLPCLASVLHCPESINSNAS